MKSKNYDMLGMKMGWKGRYMRREFGGETSKASVRRLKRRLEDNTEMELSKIIVILGTVWNLFGIARYHWY
jgi:hypothetical protein